MGNICRSPIAQGVFSKVIRDANLQDIVDIDSAGTHAYQLGQPPDPRAQIATLRQGIDISHLRARRINKSDFLRFDYIVAMDRQNHHDLLSACPPSHVDKLKLFMTYASEAGPLDIPDPYGSGVNGFEKVLELINAASLGLLDAIRLQINSAANAN
ncbi:MAG: low molecular weight phosphotyrosine protein phosphatase [Gammaproteobacteria bacterium]|nr:low molecular weight phosphotyrosine protein phosphatase [Gammaproteobacteria bacterium]